MDQARWLAETTWNLTHHYETWDCGPHGRAVLLSSLTCCSPHGPPVPIKSLALSAHVSCWTVHFQVLEESPLLGPGWGPLSCNSLCCSPRCRRSIHVPSAAIWVLSECLFQGQHLLPASVAAWLTTGCQVLNYRESFSSGKGRGGGGPFRLEATESRLGRFSLPSCVLKSCSSVHWGTSGQLFSALKIHLLPERCQRTRKKKGQKHSVKRYLHSNVHCSTVHNSQNMETN